VSGKAVLVLVAIGLLVVYSCAIPRGHGGAREAAIVSEIDQLHNAIEAYKEKHLVFPPCMAESNLDERKVRFMKHLRAVYPSSDYGSTAADFDTLNAYVGGNYQVPTGAGGSVSLDLMNLDPAEAIPFWLGGFPTPAGQGGTLIAPSKNFGFNKDSDAPIKRSLAQESTDPLATRTPSHFRFVQERLVDQDGDGWWEYSPRPPSAGTPTAPFVYFDSDCYTHDRAPPIPYPTDPRLAGKVGTVVPLAAYVDPAGKQAARWQNPDSFQILCGGLDGKLSAPNAPLRTTIFPKGFTYLGPNFTGTPTNYDEAELDNLTNLTRLTLGNARAEAP
jgi:hypothetical protein